MRVCVVELVVVETRVGWIVSGLGFALFEDGKW